MKGPLDTAASVVTQFAVSPAGPFAAISWIGLDRADVKAWILERREGPGLWERVLAAPIPARGKGEMRYAFVDTRPPAHGDYRLVAVESSGLLAPFAPVPLTPR